MEHLIHMKAVLNSAFLTLLASYGGFNPVLVSVRYVQASLGVPGANIRICRQRKD